MHLASRRLSSLLAASTRGLSTATTTPTFAEQTRPSVIRNRVEKAVNSYEEFIGTKAVKDAQNEVMRWEETLGQAQQERRLKQAEIKSLQARLKEIHFDLDRTSRGEDKYLHLLTEEHATIKKERALLETFEQLETREREAFYQLSNRVRTSHERERERVEKTKWWSVSASLLGALLGIVGASIGNEMRMRRLREMLPLGGAQMSEMARIIDDQNEKVSGFIAVMKDALKLETIQVEPTRTVKADDLDKVIATIREENARLSDKMAEMSRLAKLEATLNADPNAVVYVGSEMEHLLEQTERNLESKMKLQTLLSVVFVYAAVGVTIPLIFAFLRGG